MRQLVYVPCLLVDTIRFTCSERKIWSDIEKSQNIINMVVCKILFNFFKKKVDLQKTVILWQEFTLFFKKNVLGDT